MLYHLENNTLYKGARFSGKEQIQSYVDFITASEIWHRYRAVAPKLPASIHVFSFGDSEYSEQRFPNEIWLAERHWDQQVVLHELAHFFEDNHSPAWVRAYLQLVAQFMGVEIAAQYRRAFRMGGIKF